MPDILPLRSPLENWKLSKSVNDVDERRQLWLTSPDRAENLLIRRDLQFGVASP
jgi:hypothetical protein